MKRNTMYKKLTLLTALLCSSTQYASDLSPWLELKPSYFLFYGSTAHGIYHKGGFEVQGSASFPLTNCLDVYTSIGFRQANGYALNSEEKTKLKVVPIDLGLKPIFNFRECFYYFFAMGPRYFYFHQHNDSPYVPQKVNGGGIGFFINTGINALLTENCFVGAFIEYSFEKARVSPNVPNVYSNGSLQIGGFAFGATLGYGF